MKPTNFVQMLDEQIFLKLGLDLTRKDIQYPLIPASDLKEFRQNILDWHTEQLRILNVKHAAELSILDQDIMSLKVRIKELENDEL